MARPATTAASPLRLVEIPLVPATAEALAGFGRLVDDFEAQEIEIVTWPATGWRPVDPGTGNQGGTTEGIFEFWWEGEVLRGTNHAVGDSYTLGWSRDPAEARSDRDPETRERVFIRHANYHPDGGQLFFPREPVPFVVPLARPGDNLRPEDFIAFACDGTQGLYIHPGVWHEAIFPLAERASFLDRQGRVHARVSCDFDSEFGAYLVAPLERHSD